MSNNYYNAAVLTRPSFLYLPTSTWGVSLDNEHTELCCSRANTLDFSAHQNYAPMETCMYRIWMNNLPTTHCWGLGACCCARLWNQRVC